MIQILIPQPLQAHVLGLLSSFSSAFYARGQHVRDEAIVFAQHLSLCDQSRTRNRRNVMGCRRVSSSMAAFCRFQKKSEWFSSFCGSLCCSVRTVVFESLSSKLFRKHRGSPCKLSRKRRKRILIPAPGKKIRMLQATGLSDRFRSPRWFSFPLMVCRAGIRRDWTFSKKKILLSDLFFWARPLLLLADLFPWRRTAASALAKKVIEMTKRDKESEVAGSDIHQD